MKSVRQRWQSIAVRAFCAIALVFAAFAHRPAIANYPSDFDITAYMLPDGTIPVICLTDSEGNPIHSGHAGDCEFCRIASTFAVPEAPVEFTSCAVSTKPRFDLPEDDEFIRQAFSANAPPRGPPAGNLNS